MTALPPGQARRLDVTSLQLFVAVCECGNMARAAQQAFPVHAQKGGRQQTHRA